MNTDYFFRTLILIAVAINTVSWLIRRKTRYLYFPEKGFIKIIYSCLLCAAVVLFIREVLACRFYVCLDLPGVLLAVFTLLYSAFIRVRLR